MTDAEYARTLGGGLSFVVNAAGRRYFSPIEMSMQAPFVDAATAVDPNNRVNTFISYYTWGSVIGLNLDLTLRSRFAKSLDGFMRAVWVRFGKTEIPYTVSDLQQTLGSFTGDEAFAEDFFARYVHGSDVPDYTALLANAGFLLQPAQPDAAWIGTLNFQYRDGAAILSGMPPEGSPLYEAGISRGARILSIGGQAPDNANALLGVLGAHRPGDSVEVTFEQRGTTKTVEMLLAPNPQLVVVLYEDAGKAVTPEMTAFRAAWLTGGN
jgi:predicted metalloprotease with PDZ domain